MGRTLRYSVALGFAFLLPPTFMAASAATITTNATHGRLQCVVSDSTAAKVYSTQGTLSLGLDGASALVDASVLQAANRITLEVIAQASASGTAASSGDTYDSYFEYGAGSSGPLACGLVANGTLSRTARCGNVSVNVECQSGSGTRWTRLFLLAASESLRTLDDYLCGPVYNGDRLVVTVNVRASSPPAPPDSCANSVSAIDLSLDLLEGDVVDPLSVDFTFFQEAGTCGSVFHPENLTPFASGMHNGYLWGHSALWSFGDCTNYNEEHSSSDWNAYYTTFQCDPFGCGPVQWNTWIAPGPSGCSTSHPVTLTVSSPFNSATVQRSITNYQSPTASFAFAYPDTTDSTKVQFTAPENVTCEPTGWRWTFGDGGTSTERNPLHPYSLGAEEERRTFQVRLTVDQTSVCNATALRSVVVAKPSTPVSVPGDGARVAALSMSQSHPNPSRSGTWIGYTVVGGRSVDLEVFDPRGRRVARLVSAVQSAGEHRIWWPGVDDAGKPLPAGVYCYRITEGARSLVRKLVLLR